MKSCVGYVDRYPKLKRLVAQVEALQLHQGTQARSAEDWLDHWLSTPFDELDGRKPAVFLEQADYDLILIGLLVRLHTQTAWRDDQSLAASETSNQVELAKHL